MAKIGPLLKAAARFGPVAYPAVKKLIETMRKNPELTNVANDLVGRFASARAARSKPESLRRSVGVLRGQAQRMLAKADQPADVARAERWLDQADSMDAAIGLLTVHRGRQQNRDAARIEARLETLFAEIFTAVMEDGATVEDGAEPPGSAPRGQIPGSPGGSA